MPLREAVVGRRPVGAKEVPPAAERLLIRVLAAAREPHLGDLAQVREQPVVQVVGRRGRERHLALQLLDLAAAASGGASDAAERRGEVGAVPVGHAVAGRGDEAEHQQAADEEDVRVQRHVPQRGLGERDVRRR